MGPTTVPGGEYDTVGFRELRKDLEGHKHGRSQTVYVNSFLFQTFTFLCTVLVLTTTERCYFPPTFGTARHHAKLLAQTKQNGIFRGTERMESKSKGNHSLHA